MWRKMTIQKSGAPTEVRTPVLALRGPRPGPLDDGGQRGILPCPRRERQRRVWVRDM